MWKTVEKEGVNHPTEFLITDRQLEGLENYVQELKRFGAQALTPFRDGLPFQTPLWSEISNQIHELDVIYRIFSGITENLRSGSKIEVEIRKLGARETPSIFIDPCKNWAGNIGWERFEKLNIILSDYSKEDGDEPQDSPLSTLLFHSNQVVLIPTVGKSSTG